MKEHEKISSIKFDIEEARKHLCPEGNIKESIHSFMNVVLNYIEFMLTPCEDDD